MRAVANLDVALASVMDRRLHTSDIDIIYIYIYRYVYMYTYIYAYLCVCVVVCLDCSDASEAVIMGDVPTTTPPD